MFSLTDGDEFRVTTILAFGGYHYKIVAKKVWGRGNPKYVASPAEVARVGVIARRNNLSSLDWRNAKTPASKRLLSNLGRVRKDPKSKRKPRLTLVA